MSPELRRIAEKARTDRRVQFTSLAHLMTVDALEAAWRALKKRASAGVDGVTAAEYERDLRGNLERLHAQLRAGTYVAPPVRRSWVPKDGGARRPIGIPTVTAYCGTVQRVFRVSGRDAVVPPAGGPAIADPLHSASSEQSAVCL